MYQRIILIVLLAISFSCEDKSKTEKEIEKIPIDFEVIRFDQKFAELGPEELPEIKTEYPFLFPSQYPDSIWIAKINDTIQQELNREVNKVFPDFTPEEDALLSLFQHIKYYFPSFDAPTVITITSDVDYKNKVLLSGIISL